MSKKIRNAYTQREIERAIRTVCKDFGEFLIKKNTAYGNSAFNPLSTFVEVSAMTKLRIRQEDKLKKIINGKSFDEKEDAEEDFVGYHLLCKALKLLQEHDELNEVLKKGKDYMDEINKEKEEGNVK